MKIQVRKGNLEEVTTQAAIIAHFEDDGRLGGAAAKLDKRSGGLVGEIVSEGDFTGRLNRLGVIYTRGSIPAKRIVIVGLGKRRDFSLERLRGAYATAAQHVRSLNVSEMSTTLDFGSVESSA